MPKIAYQTKRFRGDTLAAIALANGIVAEYQAEGMRLTLRQLYYQFVARGHIANSQREYKRLGVAVSDGRLAGMIDWEAIEDRTRNLAGNTNWEDPGQIMHAAADSFRLDHWKNQGCRIEVWVEKEALVGVIAQACRSLDVDYFACKGYVSQSEMWRAAMRLRRYEEADAQRTTILHLGDHDPSGLDMTRDIEDRMRLFGCAARVERIALNWDQIEEHSPPPNPVKLQDSRSDGYVARYGHESWELDALEPRVLRDLITERVLRDRDPGAFEETLERQRGYKAILARVAKSWHTL
jgi:hypothetical protein